VGRVLKLLVTWGRGGATFIVLLGRGLWGGAGRMDRRRIPGVVSGLVLLVAVFVLPFGSDPGSPSLFGSMLPIFRDVGQVQQSGDSALFYLTFVMIGAFVVLVVAGALGAFPLASGVMGLVGVLVVSLAPTVFFRGTGFSLSLFGLGYFVVWAASVAALASHFWRPRVKWAAPPTVAEGGPVAAPPLPPPLPPGALYVPKPAAAEPPGPGEAGAEAPKEVRELRPGETTPEEVLANIDSLMRRMKSGEISSEQLREEVQKMIFRDSSGRFWSIDFRFGRWACYDGERWAPRTPPSKLLPAV